MSELSFITMVVFLVLLAVVTTFQPEWIPKPLRLLAVAAIAVIAILATVLPVFSTESPIPAWAVYLLAGISGVFVIGITLTRWLFFRYIDRSSQLSEAINACFQVLTVHKELSISDLKSKAESQVRGGIRFNRWVWAKTLEALEQEGILKRIRQNG